jgi:hypothetical protein
MTWPMLLLHQRPSTPHVAPGGTGSASNADRAFPRGHQERPYQNWQGRNCRRSAERIKHNLFTLRWWEKVLVLCFSQITFRLIPLSRSDAVPGLVHLRQRVVRLSQASKLKGPSHFWLGPFGRGSGPYERSGRRRCLLSYTQVIFHRPVSHDWPPVKPKH